MLTLTYKFWVAAGIQFITGFFSDLCATFQCLVPTLETERKVRKKKTTSAEYKVKWYLAFVIRH